MKSWLINFILPRAGKWAAAEIKAWMARPDVPQNVKALVAALIDGADEPFLNLPAKMSAATGGSIADKSLMDILHGVQDKVPYGEALYKSLTNLQDSFDTEGK